MRLTSVLDKTLLGLLVCVSVSGCSWLFGDSEPSSAPEDGSSQESAATQSDAPPVPKGNETEGIEITWVVPSEPVDAFVIRYGYRKDELNQEFRIPANQLATVNDPTYGSIYRHVIHPVAKSGRVFVSIASVRGDQISEFSPVMEENTGGNPVS